MDPENEKEKLANEVKNPVVEIVGCGDRQSAVVHLGNILSGYAQFVALHLYEGQSKASLDEALTNLESLAELIRYAEKDKLPNER